MDRFEVVFDASWERAMRNVPSFRQLADRMTGTARSLAKQGRADKLVPYWRLIVSFPGTVDQEWYVDCNDGMDEDDLDAMIVCEVPVTTGGCGNKEEHIRFRLDEDNSEFGARDCVVYSSDAVHYYTKVGNGDAPRLCLQVVMSDLGDPFQYEGS